MKKSLLSVALAGAALFSSLGYAAPTSQCAPGKYGVCLNGAVRAELRGQFLAALVQNARGYGCPSRITGTTDVASCIQDNPVLPEFDAEAGGSSFCGFQPGVGQTALSQLGAHFTADDLVNAYVAAEKNWEEERGIPCGE